MMKIRTICSALLGAVLLSDSALALSCMRPDLVKTLEEAKASPKLYHVLVGRFVSQTPTPQKGGYVGPSERQFESKPPVVTPTFFEGYALAKHAYQDSHLSRFPVDIETRCMGPWCSGVPANDREIIAFVEAREGQPPVLKISPCPRFTFRAEPAKVQKIRQCLDKKCLEAKQSWN